LAAELQEWRRPPEWAVTPKQKQRTARQFDRGDAMIMRISTTAQRLSLLLSILALAAGGCRGPAPADLGAAVPSAATADVAPRHVDGSQPIAFYRVIVDVSPGTVLGKGYGGVFHIPQRTYTAKQGAFVGSPQFKLVATKELRGSGFDVLGDENLVFGDNNSAKARFQLGATIKKLTLDTYDPFAGNFSESTVTVEWLLRDSYNQTIVLTNTTSGYANDPGFSGEVAYDAFRNALRKLIATSALADIVAKQAGAETPETNFASAITIRNPPPATALSLPADMDRVMQGVVLIKTGRMVSSGFIVSPDGYLLTAAHVVAGVDEVGVTLKSGLELTAKVVRTDEAQDVALLKMVGEGHQYLTLALDHPAPVGAEVYVIGSPGGEDLSYSVTKGIVSGYRERESDKAKFIQTDASLNRGNSGGPMLDASGNVIGIVSWKIIAPGFEGLSFGIPLEVVAKRLGITWLAKGK
jgi:hypothetical protein